MNFGMCLRLSAAAGLCCSVRICCVCCPCLLPVAADCYSVTAYCHGSLLPAPSKLLQLPLLPLPMLPLLPLLLLPLLLLLLRVLPQPDAAAQPYALTPPP
jgi:hypothetical protein